MRCGVCSHDKRTAIERAAAGGADDVVLATAQQFKISRAALSKHMATHLRALAPAAAPPKIASRRRGRAPSKAPELLEDDVEPVTSRSEDLAPSGPKRVSARDEFEEIQIEIRNLLEEATKEQIVGTDGDGKPIRARAPLPERAAVVRTAMSAVRLLANLTGELGASESAIVTSAHWKRFEGELLDILKGHPAALADVVAWLEKKQAAA